MYQNVGQVLIKMQNLGGWFELINFPYCIQKVREKLI